MKVAVEVERRSDAPSAEWDEAVRASADTWLFHAARWTEMTARVWPLKNQYFIARWGGRMVGGFPLQVARGGRKPWVRPRAYSTRMGPAGPFAVSGLSPEQRQAVLAALSDAVIRWAAQAGIGWVECALPPLAASHRDNARGVSPLVPLGWEDISTQTLLVDLRRPQEQWQSAVSRTVGKNRKTAEKRGYTVARADWLEMLDAYYDVHVETYRRTGVAPHPKAYFEGIARQFAPEGHAVLWVCRSAEGEPVAFHNTARFGDGAFYWTGCSRTEHARHGVNYLLTWHALHAARQEGCCYYDVGEVFPDTQDVKLRGLTQFKSRWGGERHRFFRAQIATAQGWYFWGLRGRWPGRHQP